MLWAKQNQAPGKRVNTLKPAAFFHWGMVVCLCLWYLAASFGNARIQSATYDEPVHLASGWSIWRYGDFRINPEHPPLAKLLAALPILGMVNLADDFDPYDLSRFEESHVKTSRDLKRSWAQAADNPNAQWTFAHSLWYGMSDSGLLKAGARNTYQVSPKTLVPKSDFIHDADRVFFWARVPGILCGLMLVLGIYAWSRALFGGPGALLSLTLACCDPNFIAHGALITTDIPACLGFFATVFFLWRLKKRFSWGNVVALGLVFGALCITKFSAVVTIPILAVLLGYILWNKPPLKLPIKGLVQWTSPQMGFLIWVSTLFWVGMTAYLMIWGSYGFRFTTVPEDRGPGPSLTDVLRQTAGSKILLQQDPNQITAEDEARASQNAELAWDQNVLAWVHQQQLLPQAYIYGFAWVRMKSLARYSFLRGDISIKGFKTYFLWSFLLKTPLAVLILLFVGLGQALRKGFLWRGNGLFLTVPVVIYGLFSLSSQLNIGHRHLLPLYPLLFVALGGLFRQAREISKTWVISVVAVLISTSVVLAPPWKPQWVFSHQLSFFNELAGGPTKGYHYLVDSNLDWGQDLKRLRHWMVERKLKQPINLCYFGMADPRYHQIPHIKMPGGFEYVPPLDRPRFEDALAPGYLAISATHLQGVYLGERGRQAWSRFLQRCQLVDRVGHSLLIYKIDE